MKLEAGKVYYIWENDYKTIYIMKTDHDVLVYNDYYSEWATSHLLRNGDQSMYVPDHKIKKYAIECLFTDGID